METIARITKNAKNAGPKAKVDVNDILFENYGAKSTYLYFDKKFKIKVIQFIFKRLFSRDILVVHYPLLMGKFWIYNFFNKNKTIIFIHDLDSLRKQNQKKIDQEIKELKKFKYIISHNDVMTNYLIKKGIDKNNIYTLEIFDYLVKSQSKNLTETIEKNKSEIEVFYTGNLKKEKAPFVYEISDKKMKFKLNLYGQNYDQENKNSKIKYYGAFEPDDLTGIKGDVGLIWDGEFDESDENKTYKNYTRYNNPHKFSCALAVGKPVIVWKKAAISKFVEENNIGYTISNIYDINGLDFSQINIKTKNAKKIAERLREGYYTKKVFNDINKEIELK